jgi:hypothetical protein
MLDRLNNNEINTVTIANLSNLSQNINDGNHQGSQQALREINSKCWADVKDFSNALKAIAGFKNKYGV